MSVSEQEKIKVAVVDNDPEYLAARQDVLQWHGFVVMAFLSSSDVDLVPGILEFAPHVVLTGVRNVDDRDPSDNSGIWLAVALRAIGIPSIVNSAGSEQDKAEASKLPFVDKLSPTEAYIQAIRAVIGKID